MTVTWSLGSVSHSFAEKHIENTVSEQPSASLVAPEPPPKPKKKPVAPASCQSEIAKYDWNQKVALAVAYAESGYNAKIVNDNPYTKDYSIGCFQINLYGANARTRPSESALKDPVTNVAWAYKIYKANGESFIGQWGVCRRGVACY